MQTVGAMLGPLGRTGRLLARHWPTLLMWALLSSVLFNLVMQAAVFLNGWRAVPGVVQSVLSLMLLSLGVLIRIAAMIAMFFVVRNDLPRLRHLRGVRAQTDRALDAAAGGRPATGGAHREPTFVDAMIVATIPFVTLYVAWDYISAHIDELTLAALSRLEDSPLVGDNLTVAFVVATVVCYGLNKVFRWCELSTLPGMRTWRGIAIYFEVGYLFFFVVAWVELADLVVGWLSGRVVWVEAAGLAVGVRDWVFGLIPVDWAPDLVDLLVEFQQPLLVSMTWLAVTAVVYGHILNRGQGLLGPSRRLQGFDAWYGRLPAEARFLMDNFTGDARAKWGPIANAVRLVWRSGPLFVLLYLAVFTALQVGLEWAVIGITYLIGPQDATFWIPLLPLLDEATSVLETVIVLALLAAFFDAMLQRVILDESEPTTSASTSPRPPEPATPPR